MNTLDHPALAKPYASAAGDVLNTIPATFTAADFACLALVAADQAGLSLLEQDKLCAALDVALDRSGR